MLHHFLVWRAIQWITEENVDWRKVGFQIPVLMQILILMLDSNLIQTPSPIGSFHYAIPMRHILGFMDDYSKVTYGMQDTLHLIRKDVLQLLVLGK